MARFASGKFKMKNPEKYVGNKTPTFRSGWEFTFMKFCDEHPSVTKWSSESIRIPYRNPLTGKQTMYVPDFLIVYVDRKNRQHVDLIEVKPSNQAVKEKLGTNKNNQAQWVVNQAKWEAARAWCKQKGINFRIVTEQDIYHQGKRR